MSISSLKFKPKLILFDLDDTLVPSTQIYQKCYRDLNLDIELLEQSKLIMKKRLGSHHVSAHQRLLYFKVYLEQVSQFNPEALFQLINNYERQLMIYFSEYWKNLNRDKLMITLKKKYKMALVTNENTRTQMLKLKAIDPKMEYFDFIVTSEEVGVEKPDFKIFNECLLRSKTDIKDILMVGDSVKNDLEPIQKLGGQVLGTSEFVVPESMENYNWLHQLDDLGRALAKFE